MKITRTRHRSGVTFGEPRVGTKMYLHTGCKIDIPKGAESFLWIATHISVWQLQRKNGRELYTAPIPSGARGDCLSTCPLSMHQSFIEDMWTIVLFSSRILLMQTCFSIY